MYTIIFYDLLSFELAAPGLDLFWHFLGCGGGRGGAVMGKHPDLMVAHPTSTIFPTIGRNFEIS
jgi:hypothetical protein